MCNQVGDAPYVFEAKTMQRMELLILSTFNWRMQAVTPFSYMDYFLNKLNGGATAPRSWLFQSAELILCAARGTYTAGMNVISVEWVIFPFRALELMRLVCVVARQERAA